jgi:hypothetical protein
MANAENIRLVIEAIRTGDGHPEIGFNMYEYTPVDDVPDQSGRGCGTAMCIGGWAYTLSTGEPANTDRRYGIRDIAADYLGLTIPDAGTLFYAEGAGQSTDDITADRAIAVLEHLIETGEVDWSVGAPDSHP